MSGGLMSGVRMSGVRMSGVRMSGVRMSGVRMSGVRMSGVRMSGVRMSGVRMSGVRMSGGRLSGGLKSYDRAYDIDAPQMTQRNVLHQTAHAISDIILYAKKTANQTNVRQPAGTWTGLLHTQ